MNQEWDHVERRRYIRVEKHFIISYYVKDDPAERHSISQLKNISLGGMCFVSSKPFDKKLKMCVELKTPYLAETAHLEGSVLGSHEKVQGMIYEIRLEFDKLNSMAKTVLEKIIETFIKLSKEERENEQA